MAIARQSAFLYGRDYAVTGHATDMPKSTLVTRSGH
jgi:hypothetical protein